MLESSILSRVYKKKSPKSQEKPVAKKRRKKGRKERTGERKGQVKKEAKLDEKKKNKEAQLKACKTVSVSQEGVSEYFLCQRKRRWKSVCPPPEPYIHSHSPESVYRY